MGGRKIVDAHIVRNNYGDHLVEAAGRCDLERKAVRGAWDLNRLPSLDLMSRLPHVSALAETVGKQLIGYAALVPIVDNQISTNRARQPYRDGLADPNLIARQNVDRHLGEAAWTGHVCLPSDCLQDRLNSASRRGRRCACCKTRIGHLLTDPLLEVSNRRIDAIGLRLSAARAPARDADLNRLAQPVSHEDWTTAVAFAGIALTLLEASAETCLRNPMLPIA